MEVGVSDFYGHREISLPPPPMPPTPLLDSGRISRYPPPTSHIFSSGLMDECSACTAVHVHYYIFTVEDVVSDRISLTAISHATYTLREEGGGRTSATPLSPPPLFFRN